MAAPLEAGLNAMACREDCRLGSCLWVRPVSQGGGKHPATRRGWRPFICHHTAQLPSCQLIFQLSSLTSCLFPLHPFLVFTSIICLPLSYPFYPTHPSARPLRRPHVRPALPGGEGQGAGCVRARAVSVSVSMQRARGWGGGSFSNVPVIQCGEQGIGERRIA